MSLIKCPDCKKDVSDQAKKCPHCGRGLKKAWTINLSSKQRMGILVGGIVAVVIVLVGVTVLLIGRSRVNELGDVNEALGAQVEDEDDEEGEALAKSDATFTQIYNEHCVTAVEKQVCRLATPQKTLTLLVSLRDMSAGANAGDVFSQLFYEITDELGIDQKRVMTDEVLDKILLGEYSVEMQFGAVRIVQFVFEGVYFVSFVVVSGYDNIYDNSAGPISTEYTLMDDSEDKTSSASGKTEGMVVNSSTKPSNTATTSTTSTTTSATTSTSGSSASSSSKPTTPTTPTTTVQTPEVKPVDIDTSMNGTTSIWGTDANLKTKLAAAYKYVYSGREFKLSADGTELTLEVTAEEADSPAVAPWSQKLSDMNATVYMMNKNAKRYDYFKKEMLVENVKSDPLVVCNLEQGIRYNASRGSWTLYLKLRPKAKC